MLVNFYLQIHRLLPPFLRTLPMKRWLWANAKPLQSLHSLFLGYRNETLDRLQVTTQTYSLEWYLNKVFNASFVPTIAAHSIDYTGGGIYIQNNPNQIPISFVWSDLEQQPPCYVYSENDNDVTYLYAWQDYWQQVNFIVWVPLSIIINEPMLRAYINRHNALGHSYEIMYY